MASLTTEAPDPKSFESWEDAFKYPIPAVRRMEQQLRSDISSNRERLRTLVGSSYRDLLGTADTIVQMDDQMHEVEVHLGDISRRCNSRLVEKHCRNVGLASTWLNAEEGRKSNASLSQLALLQKCPESILHILKRKGSLLLAAKILVLSRLLHNKTSAMSNATAFVEKNRVRLSRLRQRLLTLIDQRMADIKLDHHGLVDAICAFSLTTSSSCADVLGHFHHIRLNAVSSGFGQEKLQETYALQCLRVFIKTMQDTQSIFPRQVASALAKLKDRPLLRDETLRGDEDFNIEIHEVGLDEEIKNFIPYVRHDDLTASNAAQLLSIWTPKALSAYIDGLRETLEFMYDFQEILQLRQECLALWVRGRCRLLGITKGEALDRLRTTFQDRLKALLRLCSKDVQRVSSAISIANRSSNSLEQGASSTSLWNSDLVQIDISRGPGALTDTLNSILNGQTDQITKIMGLYQTWSQSLSAARSAIAKLRSAKWEIDDFEEVEDDLDDVEDMRYKLEKEDVRDLESAYKSCVLDAIQDLQASISREKDVLKDEESSVGKAAFLLRVARGIRDQLPREVENKDASFAFVPELQRMLALQVAKNIFRKYHTTLVKAATDFSVPGRALWDGDPELPTLPSPWSYRLLKSTQTALAEMGYDIWTKKAVNELKIHARRMLADGIESSEITIAPSDKEQQDCESRSHGSTVNGDQNSENGPKKTDEESTDAREARTQLLFDVLYLDAAFSRGERSTDTLDACCMHLQNAVQLPDVIVSRMRVASKAYWRRTSLLFALLAET